MSRDKQKKCEDCLHYGACLLNSEYVPSPCSKYEDRAGYRKAPDIAREIFEEIERKTSHDIEVNNACIVELDDSTELYHRVKGELVVLFEIQEFVAELKKKYTESEKDNG